MFLTTVVILYEFLKVFQKTYGFSSGEPRGTGGKIDRMERVQYHICFRTLNARRMFREKQHYRPRRRNVSQQNCKYMYQHNINI